MQSAAVFWDRAPNIRFDDAALEAAVETHFLSPLVAALGWPDDCVHPKVPAFRRIGRPIKSGRKPEADFVLGEPTKGQIPPTRGYVVIECKRPGEGFADAREQAESYSLSLRALLYVVTDGRQTEFWQTGWADDTRRLLAARTESLTAVRADIERILSRRAVLEYYERQKPIAMRGNFDLASYIQHVRSQSAGCGAVTRLAIRAESSRPFVSIDRLSPVPEMIGPRTRTFVSASAGRGRSTVLQQLAGAAVSSETLTYLPLTISAEDVDSSLLESLTAMLRPHIAGLESVAGLQRLFTEVAPLLLVDDWHWASMSVQKRILRELSVIANADGAVVIGGTPVGALSTSATQHLFLGPYSCDERDAVVARRTTATTGEMLEAELPPELQPLAREPVFLEFLIAALRDDARGIGQPPPNLTQIMERLLSALTDGDDLRLSEPVVTCLCARLGMSRTFGLAEVQRAIGDCGIESSAGMVVRQMEELGLWERVSRTGDYRFTNVAWRAYFQTCSAFSEGSTWKTWLHEAETDDLEVAVHYAAHLAASRGIEDDFYGELFRRDVRLYMKSLGTRTDSLGAAPEESAHARKVLSALRAGYVDMVEQFAPGLRFNLEPWTFGTTGEEMDLSLCVNGGIDGDELAFAFGFAKNAPDDLVTVESIWPFRQPVKNKPSGGNCLRGVNMYLGRMRVDSGRLVATRTALKSILEVVEGKERCPLVGWLARERMAELVHKLHFADLFDGDVSYWTIRDIAAWLRRPRWSEISAWGAGAQIISRDDLFHAMSSLAKCDGGVDLPYSDMAIQCPRSSGDVVPALKQLFDATVETYKCACESWFPHAKSHFAYGRGPFRFVAQVGDGTCSYWLQPVNDWGMRSEVLAVNGRDVELGYEEAVREGERLAAELGREPLYGYSTDARILTDWHMPVSRMVRGMLKDDISTVEQWLSKAT